MYDGIPPPLHHEGEISPKSCKLAMHWRSNDSSTSLMTIIFVSRSVITGSWSFIYVDVSRPYFVLRKMPFACSVTILHNGHQSRYG